MNWTIDSAGTGGWHAGEAPDKRAQQKMKEKGLDISKLRARQFTVADFFEFDVIYAMDESNYYDIMDQAQSDAHRQKVRMILNETSAEENLSVPDPYYGGADGFEKVFQMLEAACDSIVQKRK